MSEFIKPDIVDEEIILDPDKIIMSKTNKLGIYEFANEYFMEISGYKEYELMGKSMFCIQHPDMPEAIFKMMWEKLLNKENFRVVVKNIAKSGKYYWSLTNFTFKVDDDDEIIAIYSKRKAANLESISFFNDFYKTILAIEKSGGIDAAEKYIAGYLEERGMKYVSELSTQFYADEIRKDDFVETKKDIENLISPDDTNISKDQITKIEENSLEEDTFSIELNDKPISPISKDTTSKKMAPKDLSISEIISEHNRRWDDIENEDVVEVKSSKKVKENSTGIVKKSTDTNASKVVNNSSTDNLDDETLKQKEKSLFQKLFGKTDEEIEEERRRKAKKK